MHELIYKHEYSSYNNSYLMLEITSMIGKKYILTKSNQMFFFFFSVHDIAEATIPDFVGIIKPYAFDNYKKKLQQNQSIFLSKNNQVFE